MSPSTRASDRKPAFSPASEKLEPGFPPVRDATTPTPWPTDGARCCREPSSGLSLWAAPASLSIMSTVQEIEAAIPRLKREEVEALRAWIEDYLEDQVELRDDIKEQLARSRREITVGQYTTRQP